MKKRLYTKRLLSLLLTLVLVCSCIPLTAAAANAGGVDESIAAASPEYEAGVKSEVESQFTANPGGFRDSYGDNLDNALGKFYTDYFYEHDPSYDPSDDMRNWALGFFTNAYTLGNSGGGHVCGFGAGIYYNRTHHFRECYGCTERLNVCAHTLEEGRCTGCEFVASDDADLTYLYVVGGRLTEEFSPEKTTYTVDLAPGARVKGITIRMGLHDDLATVEGLESVKVQHEMELPIKVTAQNLMDEKTYTIKFNDRFVDSMTEEYSESETEDLEVFGIPAKGSLSAQTVQLGLNYHF